MVRTVLWCSNSWEPGSLLRWLEPGSSAFAGPLINMIRSQEFGPMVNNIIKKRVIPSKLNLGVEGPDRMASSNLQVRLDCDLNTDLFDFLQRQSASVSPIELL